MDITKAAPDRTDGGQKSPPWSDLRAVRPEIKHVHLARASKRNEYKFVIFILQANITLQYLPFLVSWDRAVSAGITFCPTRDLNKTAAGIKTTDRVSTDQPRINSGRYTASFDAYFGVSK
ncbi:hypothetical protein Bbelb_161870 [Branchiostoma belcheri]|nr:hypothetical protein Bbelb_161870 [Branchiostoma belcheri]